MFTSNVFAVDRRSRDSFNQLGQQVASNSGSSGVASNQARKFSQGMGSFSTQPLEKQVDMHQISSTNMISYEA